MTFQCAFKKLHQVAVNLGSTRLCPPKSFSELWCLIDELAAVSGGSSSSLDSTDIDHVLGPWPENRNIIVKSASSSTGTFAFQESTVVATNVAPGATVTQLIEAGHTVTLKHPTTGSATFTYYVLRG